MVIDPVGEYRFDKAHTMRLALGRTDKAREGAGFTLVTMPHRFLTIPDLFALFHMRAFYTAFPIWDAVRSELSWTP